MRHLSSRLAVMYGGRIVETGTADAVFRAPAHPYTRALLSAAPDPRRGAPAGRVPFDHGAFDPGLDLREVAAGHWAAVT